MSQFISYAQNYEDVMLWRALQHVEHGFFVDVGANDPKFDSVTYAFYERGWRGINIEPMQSYYDALVRERPEDINLHCAVGNAEGELIIYEVADTGISSVIPGFVFENKYLSGRDVLARRVPATTLNKIFQEHVKSEIHFLKIDVEGYEKPVLEGLDLKTWRPWILVVEAALPNQNELNPDFPEALITSADYHFAYFDGLNRYYIASEHSELREAFSAPPNVFDYFTLASQVKANEEIQSLRSCLESTQSTAENFRVEIENLNREITRGRSEQEALRAEIQRGRNEQGALRAEILHSRNEQEALRAELSASHAETESIRREYVNILYSKSYQITAPMRAFLMLSQKLKNRVRSVLRPSPKAVEPVETIKELEQAPSIETKNQADQNYYISVFQPKQPEKQNTKDLSG